MQNVVDPYDMPWLTIVNYAGSDTTLVDIRALTDKVQSLMHEEGGTTKMSCALANGVRVDKARSEILIALIRATYISGKKIEGYNIFLKRVRTELDKRRYKIGFIMF